MNNITRKKFLVLVTTLPIIVVLGLVLHDMRISGRMNISTDFQKADAHVSLLTPQARLRDGAVIGEPLHFTLRTPTYFDEAVFDFDMRDVATPVSLGYEQEGGITFVPIAAPLLTNLNWNYGCGDDYCVYYKPTVQDITTVPISKVATYLLDKLKPYERSYWNTTSTYELPLLGSHAFVFEVNGDALDVEFDVVSGFVGADVIFNNEVITTYETNPAAIHLGGVTPGYYEVRLRAQADAQLGQL
ncbi:hypothetical protein IT409_00450, partial [Candidatus Falkowbacteria bacterium]|nr:hypothetical protein [Candidatus Falkowbacteria bacterium]